MTLQSLSHRRSQSAIIPMITLLASQTHAFAPGCIPCNQSSQWAHRSLRRNHPLVGNTSTVGRRTNFQGLGMVNDTEQLEEQNTAEQNNTPDTINDDKLDNLIPSTMISGSSFATTNTALMFGPSGSRSRRGIAPVSLVSEANQPSSPLFQSTQADDIRSSQDSSLSDTSVVNRDSNTASWKERLLDLSNLASLLCVLDCTLLPLVSIAIPALSWGVGLILGSTATVTAVPPTLSAFLAYLPVLSHGIALYFVIPVGLLTTVINYFFGHKEVKFSMAALIGVGLIYAANSSVGVGIPSVDAWLQSTGIAAGTMHDHGGHVHNFCGAVVGAATNMRAHTCPEGLAHRVTNTIGCAFLLGSNYASRKFMEEKKSGCAASALAEAWGGDSGGRQIMVCPPGCGCEEPSFGTKGSKIRAGGEAFFQWQPTQQK